MRRSQVDSYWYTVARRPWLRVMESDVYHIPERLAEIDPELFVAFNTRTGEFEVHDASVPIPALSHVLSAGELDGRILARVMDARHDRDPFGKADAWAAAEKEAQRRRVADHAQAVAGELADLAAERTVVQVK